MSEALRSTLAANTSIKYAGGVSARDASFMAKDMRCEPDFVLQQRKRAGMTQFACYVRGFTESPVSVTLPLWPHSAIDKEPVMSETAYQKLLEQNRQQIAVLPDEHLPFRDSQSAKTRAPNVPAEAAMSPDPDADKHTDPASRW